MWLSVHHLKQIRGRVKGNLKLSEGHKTLLSTSMSSIASSSSPVGWLRP